MQGDSSSSSSSSSSCSSSMVKSEWLGQFESCVHTARKRRRRTTHAASLLRRLPFCVVLSGFVKWSSPPLVDGPYVVDGLAKSGLRVALLPNVQVRSFCDSGEYPASGGAFVVHCTETPRTQRPEQRMDFLKRWEQLRDC